MAGLAQGNSGYLSWPLGGWGGEQKAGCVFSLSHTSTITEMDLLEVFKTDLMSCHCHPNAASPNL